MFIAAEFDEATIPWSLAVSAALGGFVLIAAALAPQSWRDRLAWLKFSSWGRGVFNFRLGRRTSVSAATIAGRILLALMGIAMLVIATLLGLHMAN